MKIQTLALLGILVYLNSFGQYADNRRNLRSFSPVDFHIQLLNEDYKRQKDSRDTIFACNNSIQPGHLISISGTNYMDLNINDNKYTASVYAPRRTVELNIPEIKDNEKGPQIFRASENLIQVGQSKLTKLRSYRNLALNPYDWQSGSITFFPHVETNSVYKDQYRYSARNVVDGLVENTSHGGWKDRSWGPEKIEDPWIEIDFGRLVEVDKLVFYLRADFPHDGYWKTGKAVFDDGTELDLNFLKTEKAQTFQFEKKWTRNVRITDLKQEKPLQWCAITELEVWGREAFPVEIKKDFAQTLSSVNWREGMVPDNTLYWKMLYQEFPVEADWLHVETGGDFLGFARLADKETFLKRKTSEVLEAIQNEKIRKNLQVELDNESIIAIETYLKAHRTKREEFLSSLEEETDKFVFVKRYRFTPSFFAYTESLSDARNEHTFTPGAALCIGTVQKGEIKVRTLLHDPDGMIRDPDVSYDGKRILFAWKKSYSKDDYHLYEYTLEDGSMKQLTFGLGQADFEGKYLPDGNILFNSTRCEQTVDCWKTDVSNMYLMNDKGLFMRRIGFDQVQTTYPTVMDNGKVIYTRWDYNDRGQTFPQPLFTMNPDGTAQTEYYGNNSWYPTTITHARQIPGTNKVMATFCGHHTWQHGKVGIVDPSKGRQENSGIELLAPKRKEEAVRIDRYGQKGIQFQYPYPFDENNFLITCDPVNKGEKLPFSLYFMNADGERELLVSDDKLDCKQAVPLKPRSKGFVKPSRVDYKKNTGYYYVQNVYHGPGAEGIPEGSIEKIRVVSLEFRAAPVRGNHGSNDEGGVRVANLASTPVALGQGAWDVKRILGEVPVEKDGSAMFEVPARTPLYFQLIDTAGYVAQTMRSWSTLQPGESFSCIGCHEDKNESVPLMNKSMAMARGVQGLQDFYGINEGFSFPKHVQPIINKHCVACHDNPAIKRLNGGSNSISELSAQHPSVGGDGAFSLRDEPVKSYAGGRAWSESYLNLLQASYDINKNERSRTYQGSFKSDLINWPGMQSVPSLLPPYYRGSATSGLMKMLRKGHGDTKLSQEELDIIACWIDLQVPYCGNYKEANIWSESEMEYYDYYLSKREKSRQLDEENIKKLLEYMGQDR